MDRPLCKCHGEPKARNGYHPGGNRKWQCARRNRQRMADWYDNLTGVEYSLRILRQRRRMALERVRQRGSL